jgi:hypothetical protein
MISIIDWLIRLPFRTLFIFKSFDFVPCQENKECNRFPQRNLNKTKVSDVRFTSARSIVHCSRSRRRQLWGCWKTWRPKHVVYSIWLLRDWLLLYWILLFFISNDRIPLQTLLSLARALTCLCVYVAYIPSPPESPAHTPWGPPTFPPEHSDSTTVHPDWLEKMEGGFTWPGTKLRDFTRR